VQTWQREKTDAWIQGTGWLRRRYRAIAPAVPARAFTGTYDQSGTVAATMAEMILTELPGARISEGLLDVARSFPHEMAPARVFQRIIELAGGQRPPDIDNYGCFCEDYETLLALVAWSLSCGWEVNFVAANRRFAFTCDEDSQMTVFWADDEPVWASAAEALLNNDFKEQPMPDVLKGGDR